MQYRDRKSPQASALEAEKMQRNPRGYADHEVDEHDDREVALVERVDFLQDLQRGLLSSDGRSDKLHQLASEKIARGEQEVGEEKHRAKLPQRDDDAAGADKQHGADIDRGSRRGQRRRQSGRRR